jgi:hypothetical protein
MLKLAANPALKQAHGGREKKGGKGTQQALGCQGKASAKSSSHSVLRLWITSLASV